MAELTEDQKAQLRVLIWERDETLIDDTVLQNIWDLSNDLMERAAAIGWAVKGGFYVERVTTTESGAERRYSDMYRNAERQWKLWDERAAKIEDQLFAEAQAAGRVVGVPINVNSQCELEEWIFSEEAMYIRYFPLYRFPAILSNHPS